MAQRYPFENSNRKKDLVEPDLSDPKTWSLDDPLLWLHEEWYRKYNGLTPDAPIPDHPALRANKSDRLKMKKPVLKLIKPCARLPRPGCSKGPTESFMLEARTPRSGRQEKKVLALEKSSSSEVNERSEVTGDTKDTKTVTSESTLKAILQEKIRSVTLNEMLVLKDPDFDVEEDWYTPYQEHFTTGDQDANEDFSMWLAAKHYKMEETMKKHLADMKKAKKKEILEEIESLNSKYDGVNRNRRKRKE